MATPTKTLAKTPKQRMEQARTNLVMHNPFFGVMACSLEWVQNDDIPTMATDGNKIYWSSKFVEELDTQHNDGKGLQRILFVQCHEIMHCILDHLNRAGGRNPTIWNFATDYVINQTLVDDRVGIMPDKGLLDREIFEQGRGRSETIYEIIYKEMKDKMEELGLDNGWGVATGGLDRNGQKPFDGMMKPPGSKAEQDRRSAEMKVMVASAANAAKQAGKLSAGMELFVGEVVKAKVDWRTVMRNFVGSRAKIDRSYSIINTQLLHLYQSHGLLFPGRSGETLGEVVLCVDCSGSTYGKILDAFAAEGVALHAAKKPSKLHVIYFDSEVSHHDEFGPDDTVKIKLHGGGGTAFSPIFRYIKEKGIEPVACVVLTDLECNDFGPAPNYPVLWMSSNPPEYSKAPWGRVCPIQID